MIHLRQTTTAGDVLHEFDQPEVLLGRVTRSVQADLDLAPDPVVSRSHARLRREADGYWLEDLGSKHGTFVNGVRLDYPRRLNLGDVIHVGQTALRVEHLPVSAEISAAPPLEEPPDPEEKVEHALEAGEVSAADPSSSLSHSREELHFLLELPALFNAQPDADSLLRVVIERVVKIIPGAERGALLLPDGAGALAVRASVPAAQPAVSRSLARRAFAEGRAFAWRRPIGGSPSESLVRIGTRTGMYAPMLWKERALGVLSVDTTHPRGQFTKDDLRLLLAVAHFAALALTAQRRA